MILVVSLSSEVISALRILDRRFTLKMAAKCVLMGAPCCRNGSTRRLMAATAQARGCPVVPCLMDSTLTSFFCVVKRRLKTISEAQVVWEDMVAGLVWVPTKNWVSNMFKGVETVYVPPAQYLSG